MCFGPHSRPISRRRLLAAGGLALAMLAGGDMGRASAEEAGITKLRASAERRSARAGQVVAQEQAATVKPTVIGRSRGGQPITAYHLGDDRQRVVILGGQHGSPEANAVNLADAVLDFFGHHPSAIPKGMGLDIVTVANPDGYITGSRQYLSGVDPNRNWASGDWEPDAYDSLGRYLLGLGGPVPMSEPETRSIAAWLTRRRPDLLVNFHSAGGFVSASQDGLSWELAEVYGDASGYPSYGPDAPWGYPITGAMDGWLAGRGIADLFVELSTLTGAEIEENLAGLVAVLERLAAYAPLSPGFRQRPN